MAGSYLGEIARADLDSLAAEDCYDLQTAEYFRRRDIEAEAARVARTAGRKAKPVEDEQDEESELDELEAELEAYELQRSQGPALLTGPKSSEPQQPIRMALAALTDQDEIERRMDELAYLANLLMAGTVRDGERILETPAAEIAMATCNLGASYLLWIEFGDDASVAAFTQQLGGDAGIVRLFRVGWHLLSRVPVQVVSRLQRLLADPALRADLAQRPMVLSELDALLGDDELSNQIRAGQFVDARDTLRLLTILLEPTAVSVLCALVDATPRLSNALEATPGSWDEQYETARDIDSMADLMQVDGFLKSLSMQIRANH
jgi:hypothetical protein